MGSMGNTGSMSKGRMWRTLVVTGGLVLGLSWPLGPFGAPGGTDGVLSAQGALGQQRTARFAGPVIGLKYETPTVSGVTNERGELPCRDGEQVAFLLGGAILGTTNCAERVTLAHLEADTVGRVERVNGYGITNMARLVQTLDQDGIVENGVTITPKMHEVIGNRPLNFHRSVEEFTTAGKSGDIHQLLGELDDAKVFAKPERRWLRSAVAARNELRRNIRGIIKMRDVRIPTRDGSYLMADVFRPDDDEPHPVVVTLSIYGKESFIGCVCNETDYERHEEIEDDFFSGNPHNERYENHESANTLDWVPYGYAVARVDGRGTCNSPGEQYPFSLQEAKDYYDTIEWLGTQPWSNGNVGTWGASYTGWNQPPMASLQPPHLKAMIPVSSDHKYTEDVVFIGGLYNEGFVKGWWLGWSRETCRVRAGVNDLHLEATKLQPFFYDPAAHGPTGSLWMDPDMSKVVVPQWTEMPPDWYLNIHQRGTSEQFIRSATPLKDKKLILSQADWMADAYDRVAEHRAFFDYYLKGKQNDIPNMPPVRLFIPTGNGAGYHRYADDWPVPGTNYTKWYLDATPSDWEGDGQRSDFLRLSLKPPTADRSTTYSAEADVGQDSPPTPGRVPCWATGASFVSDPLAEDLVLAGHMKLAVSISSTSSDADVHASFRVMDENNREVNYSGRANNAPMFWGPLQVGHRKLDPRWSTDWRPIYTYAKEDYKPLAKGEIVDTQVELWATALHVKAGHRLRLDVQPTSACGRRRLRYDPSYHVGAENTVYTGPDNLSYLQVPAIPTTPSADSTAAGR